MSINIEYLYYRVVFEHFSETQQPHTPKIFTHNSLAHSLTLTHSNGRPPVSGKAQSLLKFSAQSAAPLSSFTTIPQK